MCVSTAPARLSRTIVYAGVAHRAGTRVHVMGYQNQAENLDAGPNCMILHIPSAAPMTPENMVDTAACPWLLSRLARAARGIVITAGAARSRVPAPAAVHVFQKGIYTVVLANHWELAHQALERVPAHQRPVIAAELLQFYGERFPGWHLALCCFENREAVTSDPLLWWFEPMFPDRLMAPGIDAHDGKPPSLRSRVYRDHELVFGTDRGSPLKSLVGVNLQQDSVPHLPRVVRELLPSLALHVPCNDWTPNGDFLLDVADLERGHAAVAIGTLGG